MKKMFVAVFALGCFASVIHAQDDGWFDKYLDDGDDGIVVSEDISKTFNFSCRSSSVTIEIDRNTKVVLSSDRKVTVNGVNYQSCKAG